MTLLILSPDFASHYRPLAVVGRATAGAGTRVVVATGTHLRRAVEADGFEWRHLRLGASGNTGIVERSPAIDRFLAATRDGPAATLRLQAQDRLEDLLWQPEQVARDVAELADAVDPDLVVVDHVSFGATLAAYATGRPFVTVVPGHPTQLPVAQERYGVPPMWPHGMTPDRDAVQDLERLADTVTDRFTDRWNRALSAVAPDRRPVDDAFRVHGEVVLYNSVPSIQDPSRAPWLPRHHRFVGPLTRDEHLPADLQRWAEGADGRRVYVALGTFLSHRGDVLAVVADGLRRAGARAAIALGPTPVDALGDVPDHWVIAATLPQVALLAHTDLAIHHGGNNSVQESLAAGTRQLILPFSTDQFANAADLERVGAAAVAPPNTTSADEFAAMVEELWSAPAPTPAPRPTDVDLIDALGIGIGA